MASISLCMIVKNEEKNIRRALEWGKGIMMEQIVVDTGSTDRTVEIAQELGAQIYHYSWTGDFSAAKNYAISKANGNWIAFLDADEYFLPEDVEQLWKLLVHLERDVKPEKRPHIIRTRWANLTDQGKLFSISVQDRIFQRTPLLRYRNRIHEYIGTPPGIPVRILEKEELTILHTGYTKQAVSETNKAERNIELLKKELEIDPENYNALVYLGDALALKNQIQEAMECYQEAIKHKSGKKLTAERYCVAVNSLLKIYCLVIISEQKNEIERLCDLLEETLPGFPDTTYYHGRWLMEKGQEKEAERFFLETLERTETYRGNVLSYASTNLQDIYTRLSLIYYRNGNPDESMRFGILSLRMNRYNQSQLNILIALFFMNAGQERQKVAEGAWEVLSKLYDVNNQKDQLFLLRAAKAVPFQEFARVVLQNLPEQDSVQMS